MRKYVENFNNFDSVKESVSKDIFKSFGIDWFIINNELPSEHSYIFLNPFGGYRTIIFDFGFEYTILKEEDLNNLEYLYKKVNNIINKYDLYTITNIKNDKSFFIEARLEGEENITDIIKKYDYIYHVTLDKYIPSILKNGLVAINKSPDLENYSYDYNKLHLTNNPFNVDQKVLLYDFIMKQKDSKSKVILLKIGIKNLDIDFYLDKDTAQLPNEYYNFWTNSNIPLENIKIVEFK